MASGYQLHEPHEAGFQGMGEKGGLGLSFQEIRVVSQAGGQSGGHGEQYPGTAFHLHMNRTRWVPLEGGQG